jgi:hypothetical protein
MRRMGRWVLASSCVLALSIAAPAAAHHGRFHFPNHHPGSFSFGLRIVPVSNTHPQLVSGEQLLLAVKARSAFAANHVRVFLNGHDVTSSFHSDSASSLLGLVTGLRQGNNLVTAITLGGVAALQVDDHPITGPVFSGPQQTPFFCETTAFGLAPATQPLCSAPTTVSYMYKNTAGQFKTLADPTTRPADLANATVNGTTVPYIVRLEQGTIDRGVYQIAALYDGKDPSPFSPDTSWNGRLVYTFGGGCNAGYHQGSTTGGVINDLFLSQGYAVASNTLNVLDNNCSPIISAEAAMMTKEHFIETYGPVAHTIGWGGSGGAIQQYDIAESYPGILNGIVPSISFPDPFTTGGPVTDCRLLDTYIDANPGALSAAAQQAVAGFLDYTSCRSWDATFASRATPTDSCSAAIPVSVRWDPVTNPTGVKCESTEQVVNQLGRDPNTGFVRSLLDNVGVQYGLNALKSGAITPDQFVTLNAKIGGLTMLGKPGPAREVADPQGLNAAYADDLVNSGSLGLRKTPVIDQRLDLDSAGFGNDIHTSDWSFVMRARLQEANGTAANQVIIDTAPTAAEIAATNSFELDAMDRWLTAIDNDHHGGGLRRKVIADRPADVSDGCYLSATQRIQAPVTDPATGPCAALYPVGTNPRTATGQPLSMMALKCQLQKLNFNSYGVTFTPAQQATLQTTFPDGVCNYNKKGVAQRGPIGDWLSYGDETTGLTPPTPIR